MINFKSSYVHYRSDQANFFRLCASSRDVQQNTSAAGGLVSDPKRRRLQTSVAQKTMNNRIFKFLSRLFDFGASAHTRGLLGGGVHRSHSRGAFVCMLQVSLACTKELSFTITARKLNFLRSQGHLLPGSAGCLTSEHHQILTLHLMSPVFHFSLSRWKVFESLQRRCLRGLSTRVLLHRSGLVRMLALRRGNHNSRHGRFRQLSVL